MNMQQWWNGLTASERLFWVRQTPTHTPSEAWEAFNGPRYEIQQLTERAWKVSFIENAIEHGADVTANYDFAIAQGRGWRARRHHALKTRAAGYLSGNSRT